MTYFDQSEIGRPWRSVETFISFCRLCLQCDVSVARFVSTENCLSCNPTVRTAKTKLSQKSKFHYSPRRLRFASRSVQVGFIVEKVTLNQVFSESFGFPLSILFQSCSIFIHVSCTGRTKGPLAAAVSQRHSLTPLQQ